MNADDVCDPMKIYTTGLPNRSTNIELATRKIQLWWRCSVKNRRLFHLLRDAICCAEHSVTPEILRKLIPREADLLQDVPMRPKVRFRLKGDTFPPLIVFKIFLECSSIKYISGKSMIRPSSEASEDARRQMGNRIYFDQLLRDACQHQELAITDVIDIATVKDYMKYKSGLDESPAYLGGRENHWRTLTLDVVPRHTKMYNVLEFLTDTNQMSKHLSIEKLNGLCPSTDQEHQTAAIRTASSISLRSKVPKKKENKKSIAKRRAEKMRMNYILHQTAEVVDGCGSLEDQENLPQFDDMDDDLDDNNQAINLYEWTQELSFEELK